MASRFTRFNKTRDFNIDTNLFEKGTYLTAQDIYEDDIEKYGAAQAHLLVGVWKHDIPEDNRVQGLPGYSYTLGIKIENCGENGDETKYYYVNCPAFMVSDFDEILADKSLVRLINEGKCSVCAYQYVSRAEERFAFEFC